MSQPRNYPPILSLLLMLFSGWSKRVSNTWLLGPIHLKGCHAFQHSECTEAEKVDSYLAKFASLKMWKVSFLGQESDWMPSKCLAKICLMLFIPERMKGLGRKGNGAKRSLRFCLVMLSRNRFGDIESEQSVRS